MIDSRKIGLVLIAALVGFAPRAMAQTGGLSPGARLQSPAGPPPLTQFKTLTLPTVGGDIDAVLYNGNTLVTCTFDSRIVEIDSGGAEVWTQATDGRPYRARRR